MKNNIFVNPSQLSHYFHACGVFYIPNTDIRAGGVQGYAESENELYALIESEDWEHDSRVSKIICKEVMDGNIIRTWTL